MVLFAVNTGLRDSNACQLQWLWEVPIPDIKRLLALSNPVLERSRMITFVRVANGGADDSRLWTNGRAEVAQLQIRTWFWLPSH